MREIKFRAWTDRNRYIENYCYLDKNNHFFGEDLTNGPIVKILAVEQFTGLHDCDGKEIYEGDIVTIKNSDIIRTVKYKNNGFVMASEQAENDCWYYSEFVKIIGNIHEVQA